MSALNNSLLLGQEGGGGYAISRSLRFNSADSSFLSRTPASAGNRKTWTWAGWVKRSALSDGHLFACTSGATDSTYARLWITNNRFYLGAYSVSYRGSTAFFRDPSAWYHFVCAVDTTQATGANRIRMYVNGTEITSFAESSDPAQNADLGVNQNTAHRIGSETNTTGFFNGYLADIHFIDGQALDPTSFGEFSANTGVWMPKKYTGTYGTNGFKLDFSDNSAATATTLGKDSSGNGNNWTPNNLSVTAGAGNDSLVDVPVNGSEADTGAGGQVTGNYCTLNPLVPLYTGKTLSDGNLQVSGSTANQVGGHSTFGIPTSGKWYCEMVMTASAGGSPFVGVGTLLNVLGLSGAGYRADGTKELNGANSSYGSSWTTNDVIGVAFDSENNSGQITFYKNGVSQGVAYTGLNTTFSSGLYFSCQNNATGTTTFVWNFGQRPFAYTAPSGFKALNTANLPAPVITKPSTVMDVKLYTGNGSTQTISGLGFSPDLVWAKNRSSSSGYWHTLVDSVRGAGKNLASNSTNAEDGPNYLISALNSDGFSVNVNPNVGVNENGGSHVAWCWDAGSSTVTNTQGSITSSVRANATAGFSVVTFTAPSSGSATIGHGLGVEPQMIIIKSRDQTYNWCVYHKNLTSNAYFLNLNTTAAQSNASNIWNNTTPTSTLFSLGSGYAGAGATVAYCFAPVAGYSSMGSYTGNGSADGPFVYTGFRPRWVMVKRTDSTGDWYLYDSARGSYNFNSNVLYPNLSNEEVGQGVGIVSIDMLSNGFKPRTATGALNASGGTYIFASFAENPFQYARAR